MYASARCDASSPPIGALACRVTPVYDHRVGTVRIVLDTSDYEALDAAMIERGYATGTGPAGGAVKLPQGSYWLPEPTDPEVLRNDAVAALRQIGEPDAQIFATAGPSAWHGLPAAD